MENGVADIFGPEEISPPSQIECGSSNTTLKLFLPLASIFENEIEFFGTEALAKNPLQAYVGYIERLGAACLTPSGFLPVRIKGPITQSQMVYFPKLGTQFLSGILLCAPLRGADTEIGIDGKFHGWEYAKSTIDLMKECGIAFSSSEKDFIYVQGAQSYGPPEELKVPASPYLSSYPILAGALAGRVSVEGIPEFKKLQILLDSFGASASSEEGNFSSSAGSLSGIELSMRELGRLLPHAIVLGSVSTGSTKITGISSGSRLEKARMRVLMRSLSKMGASFAEKGEDLIITGGKLSGAEVYPEGDAAVAMALSAAALAATGQTKIIGADCVSRSYPDFFKDLASLGALIR